MNKRRWLYILAATVFLVGLLPFGGSPIPARADDSRTFPETGHTVKGLFLNYWNIHGGLAQQGYPISEELQEVSDTDGKTYTVQYFQRAVFERHPEYAGTPSEVLLSLLGVFYYNDKYGGNAPGQKANPDNPHKFTETGKTIGGAFRQYWESHGGLAQQGYPISDEFLEVASDGKTYTVQYFQRAVFEYHPEFAGTPNQVLLSLLGVASYNKKHGGGTTPTIPAPVQPTATTALPTGPTPTTVPPQPPIDNSGQVIYYNSQTGKSVIGRVDASGNYADLKAYTTWMAGWDQIVPLGQSYVLFYQKSSGLTTLGRVATDGTYTDIQSSRTLGAGWTHVVSAGANLILYYKAGTGTGGVARVNITDGSIALLKVYTTFNPAWTHIVGLDNNILLFYQRGSSTALTLRVHSDGVLEQLKVFTNWSTIWDHLVPGTNGTVLQYYSIDGRAVASKFDVNGNETVLMRYGPGGEAPLPNPYPVVAGMSNGTLLFYNDGTRQGTTGRLSGDGAVAIYNRYPAGNFGVWTQVVGMR